ncbi:hypothetical protein AVEN_137016-1 [Araneus ventricosus]|uniref:Uncharacterized protein n=1 Tax=Araneus ventricosus TaxID=182803 RepID=A0A4Y2ISZ1_ARAVE|nr:hypothetical protein AVEN_137016-1 [Araneus ventricosus]
MAIQVRKSKTSCPQLVYVPLTGFKRILSSPLNMALSLPTSKGFTCLTAIIAVVLELARHLDNIYKTPNIYKTFLIYKTLSVLVYEEASAKLRTRMAEKSRQ